MERPRLSLTNQLGTQEEARIVTDVPEHNNQRLPSHQHVPLDPPAAQTGWAPPGPGSQAWGRTVSSSLWSGEMALGPEGGPSLCRPQRGCSTCLT